ncbi:MAG TPA: hypothetical protein VII40_06300 [Xanthobacteraceae bacterium]
MGVSTKTFDKVGPPPTAPSQQQQQQATPVRVNVSTVHAASRRASITIERVTTELSRDIAAKIADSKS